MKSSTTGLASIAGLVVVVLISLAAVTMVAGEDALQRLGLFFGVAGASVAALVAAVRADAAAKSLHDVDGRLEDAIRRTNRDRRFSDADE